MKEDPRKAGYLGSLLADPSKIRRAAVTRRKPYEEKSVPADALPEYEKLGWQFDRSLKRLTKVKRQKPIDERLRNRLWLLFVKLGYPEVSDDPNFTILIERKGTEPVRRRVDVYAKDEETVIVAQCIASSKPTRRGLRSEIEEFANFKGPMAAAIRKHYGPGFRPKIIWLLVTENVIWSDPDKQRALGENIRAITERELRYYSDVASHLGRAARYQFLAEFLKDQEIPELAGQTVPAIKGKLGGRPFYCFVTTPRVLLKISFVNHRSLSDPEGAPSYQRLVSKSRIRDIGEFIKKGGYFPNNILINFTRAVRFEKNVQDPDSGVIFGRLFLPDTYRSAWIIDGQHRLYGFSPIDDRYLDQNIIVLAFELLPSTEEANLFVTINTEQKSVPKHLLDDLMGDLKWDSTIPSERIAAISARLIGLLNADVDEPFYNRITRTGMSSTNKTCLTIPALKEALRRSALLGRATSKNSTYELGALCGSTDGETLDRARSALNSYFGLVRNANLVEWESGREGCLCTNIAVYAYILLFGSLVKYWEANTATDARDMAVTDIMVDIEVYMRPVLEFLETNKSSQIEAAFKVPFGSGGPIEYYYRLCKAIKEKCPDFVPDGMEKWEEEQSVDKILDADAKLKGIVSEMRKYIFDVFRTIYGEEKDLYWEKGVTDNNIKADAYKISLDTKAEERLPLETYLEVVQMKKIVENKKNWPLFKAVFNIPDPGEKGIAKNTKWMERVNELRRIPAHPAKERKYKVEDFEYIDFVYEELMKRIKEGQANPVLESTGSEDDDG